MKLLLVEDEEALSQVLAKGLRKCGYAVDIAYDGEEALLQLEVNEYDLMILDLNLPRLDGLDVLREIRKTNRTIKILILSARTEIEDRVLGLDLGANDYLIKPFDFLELEARIRTLLRWHFIQQPSVLECGGIILDTTAKTVWLSGQLVSLTKKEYAILEYLMAQKGRVVSSEELIEHVWDSEVDLFSNSLKYHIYSLKKKLREQGGGEEVIRNLRGQGYIMEDNI